jgi:hypothetical protein
MFTKFFVLGAALIIAAPTLAASNGSSAAGSANSSAAVGHAAGAGGGSSGGAAGGGGGSGHGAGLGAHSAAMSTHLGGAGHTLHAATAHAVAAHAPPSQRVATASKPPKKPGPGEDRTRHLFLHRTVNNSSLDWSICMMRVPTADGWRSDCDRPAKSSSSPHT